MPMLARRLYCCLFILRTLDLYFASILRLPDPPVVFAAYFCCLLTTLLSCNVIGYSIVEHTVPIKLKVFFY